MWFLPTGQTATLPWRVSELRPEPGGAGRGLGWGQFVLFCNMRRWEILTRPLPSSDWWPLPLTKGPHLCGKVCVCVCHSRVAHAHFKYILAASPVLYFRPPVSLSFCLCLCGITSLCRVSELHPLAALPVLQKQDYLAPLRGSWCIFGLVSLDTSPTELSVPSALSTLVSFPHIYLMSLFISFTHFHFLPQLLPCSEATSDSQAPASVFSTQALLHR